MARQNAQLSIHRARQLRQLTLNTLLNCRCSKANVDIGDSAMRCFDLNPAPDFIIYPQQPALSAIDDDDMITRGKLQ